MSTRPSTTIDREHGPAFTVVDNALLRDSRLALDEKGLLCWFLSLPLDWEVIPAHVRKENRIGRDKYQRIMKSLRSAGYIKLIVERSEDGTISCIRYRVRAIPVRDGDPAIPEVRVDAEIESAIEAADAPDEPVIPGDQDGQTVAALQQPEKTVVVANQSPGNPDSGKPDPRQSTKDLENTPPTPQTPEVRPPPSFRDLCAKWPSDRILSVSAAEKRFLRLSEDKRRMAVEGATGYLSIIRAKGWKVCDLQQYLRERRWESVKAGPPVACCQAAPGSPQAARWIAYWEAIGQPTEFVRGQLRMGRPITTLTEWPPPLPNSLPKKTNTG